MNITVRPATSQDSAAINELGNCTYPILYAESDESFASKLKIGWAWVAVIDAYIVGYLVAVPYVLGEAYPLNAEYTPHPNPNCLYIHDLCVSARFRGLGLGTRLVQEALNSPWQNFSLIAVLGAEKFWASQGFVPIRELNYFGGQGVYMELKR